MSLSKPLDLAQAQRAVPCDSCGNDVPGVYYCIECKETYCENCETFHKKFTKDHNVILRTEVADFDTNGLNCDGHEEQATFYCEKCDTPVCDKCVTGMHQGHKIGNLTSIIEKKKKMLQSDLNEIQGYFLPKMMKQKEDIENERDNYNKRIESIIKEIETENRALHEELDQVNREKVESLNDIQARYLNVFNAFITEVQTKIMHCQQIVSKYQVAIDKNSLRNIISLVERKEPVPPIVNKPYLPEPPLFLPRDIQIDMKTSLAMKLFKIASPTIVSTFKSPLKGTSSICISNIGDVWLGGDESKELVLTNIKGHELRRRKVQYRINSLAYFDNHYIIISPHPSDSTILLKQHDNEKEQHVYNMSPSYGTGVSCTGNQKLLICTVDGKVVRTNSDGSDPIQICKGSGSDTALHAVENNDGDIYISDRKNSRVNLVNKEGTVMLSIKSSANGEKLRRPVGLVIDKLGNILCADKESDCIFIIDQRHIMRELVGRAHGINKPRWLAVDNDHHLWVTQYDGSVQVVKYVAY